MVFARLDAIHAETPITMVIHGGATGADTWADQWAKESGIEVDDYPIHRDEWKRHGPAMGPIRNQMMITDARPELVVAFPGGRGTADMVRKAEKAGIGIVAVLPLRGE